LNNVKAIRNKKEISRLQVALAKHSPRYKILFMFGIETGLRVSDILKLKVIDVAHFPLNVMEKKTKKIRIIKKLSVNLQKEIDDFIINYDLETEDYLFFSSKNAKKKHVSRVQAYRVFKLSSKECDIDNIGTHSMRKTYALEHFRKNQNIEMLQQILNHKFIQTTIQYLFDINLLNKLQL
jgi:integrase